MNNREQLLVRAMIDEVKATCDTIRNSYPERYPVPPDVDAMLSLEAKLIDKARSSGLN